MANGTVVGIDEAKLWSMADALRNNMDAAEYKHVVLGLIFLKYFSDAFEAKHARRTAQERQALVYVVPPARNTNFAWVQHFIYHLAPGFVLANGSMSSNQSDEGEIRRPSSKSDAERGTKLLC